MNKQLENVNSLGLTTVHCLKNSGQVSGGSVSKHTKGITLNVVPLHLSTQTVS
jgi:hypothetical protein